MLKAEHLSKHYCSGVIRKHHVDAVSGVSFEIGKGEILGIAGNSGCGKSTIARMLMGLEDPDEGAVWLDGQKISGLTMGQMREHRKKMQMIFQHPESSLDPQKKILFSMTEPMKIHRVYREQKKMQQRIEELFDLVGVSTGLLSRYPHQISGGEAQRIMIARALTLDPKVLILDEPTSMLDVSIQAHVMCLLKDLRNKLDLTYLFISHDLEVLGWFCDRISIMSRGKFVESGDTEQIIHNPGHHGKHAGHVTVRTIIRGPVADDLPGFEDTWEIFVAYTNRGVSLVIFQQYIVTWLVFLYQVVFE